MMEEETNPWPRSSIDCGNICPAGRTSWEMNIWPDLLLDDKGKRKIPRLAATFTFIRERQWRVRLTPETAVNRPALFGVTVVSADAAAACISKNTRYQGYIN
jgi:hypothetical protein